MIILREEGCDSAYRAGFTLLRRIPKRPRGPDIHIHYMCVYMCMYIYIYSYVYTYTLQICVYIYIYVCMYVCMYKTYVYIYIYIYNTCARATAPTAPPERDARRRVAHAHVMHMYIGPSGSSHDVMYM